MKQKFGYERFEPFLRNMDMRKATIFIPLKWLKKDGTLKKRIEKKLRAMSTKI